MITTYDVSEKLSWFFMFCQTMIELFRKIVLSLCYSIKQGDGYIGRFFG